MTGDATPNAGRRPEKPAQTPTGIGGLDRLLTGGLREGALHVLLGGAGTGKSVLAHQIGAAVARAGGKVLYLTALIETHQTLLAQARTFRFFDPAVVPRSFYYASLFPALSRGGVPAAREEISRLVAQHAPTLLILDGVHAIKLSVEGRLEYQQFMHELEAQCAVSGVTTLLLAHPSGEETASDPTFTIADAIFEMKFQQVRLRQIRTFAVIKLRGVAQIGGWHTFRITADGIRIYPRTESLAAQLSTSITGTARENDADELLDLEVKGLGKMLGGGVDRSSVTLVVGTPGSGKSMLGMAFLTAGAAAGEPGLLLGYHETPDTLLRKAEGVSLPIRRGIDAGLIHLHWRVPVELLVDEETERLLTLVETHGLRRVVIDALEDLHHSVIPKERDLYFLAGLANLLRERGVTTILLQDLTRIVGVNFDLPMAELSALVDNVLHLRYVERKGQMQRIVTVLKVRAREYDHALRELRIERQGLSVGKAFDHSEMVLTGLALPR